jgi:DNA-binding NarL/FixJ family response regulator
MAADRHRDTPVRPDSPKSKAGGALIPLDRRARDETPEPRSPAVQVLIADGRMLVRAGLRELLEATSDIAVADEAASGGEAVAVARTIRPDVVLMNAHLPGLDGLEATRRITTDPSLSEVRVLILSYEELDDPLAALRAGASGLLAKNAEPAELLRAVRLLALGGVELSPSLTRSLIERFTSQVVPRRPTLGPFGELTDREREVVALVAYGLSNREIADQLVVSSATVKTHVSRSMVKLRVHDRAQLVALAYQTGFAQTPP